MMLCVSNRCEINTSTDIQLSSYKSYRVRERVCACVHCTLECANWKSFLDISKWGNRKCDFTLPCPLPQVFAQSVFFACFPVFLESFFPGKRQKAQKKHATEMLCSNYFLNYFADFFRGKLLRALQRLFKPFQTSCQVGTFLLCIWEESIIEETRKAMKIFRFVNRPECVPPSS